MIKRISIIAAFSCCSFGHASDVLECFSRTPDLEKVKKIIAESEPEGFRKTDPEAFLECHLAVGDYGAIIRSASKIASQNTPYFLDYYLGRAYFGMGKYDEAVESLEGYMIHGMSDHLATLYLAKAYRRKGLWLKVVGILVPYLDSLMPPSSNSPPQGVITLSDSQVEVILELSGVYLDMGDVDSAREVLLKGVRQNTGSKAVMNELVELLGRHGPQNLYEYYLREQSQRSFLD